MKITENYALTPQVDKPLKSMCMMHSQCNDRPMEIAASMRKDHCLNRSLYVCAQEYNKHQLFSTHFFLGYIQPTVKLLNCYITCNIIHTNLSATCNMYKMSYKPPKIHICYGTILKNSL